METENNFPFITTTTQKSNNNYNEKKLTFSSIDAGSYNSHSARSVHRIHQRKRHTDVLLRRAESLARGNRLQF